MSIRFNGLRKFLLRIIIQISSLVLATSAFAEDSFEPDDRAAIATIITVSSLNPQRHDFSHEADQDWYKFYALKNEFYEVLVDKVGTRADPVIELYKGDGRTRVWPVIDDGIAGDDELLSWQAPEEGYYFIKVRNHDSAAYGAGTQYDIVLYRPVADKPGIINGIVRSNQDLAAIAGALIKTNAGGTAIVKQDGTFELEANSGLVSIQSIRAGFTSQQAQLQLQPDEKKSVILEMQALPMRLLQDVTTFDGSVTTANFAIDIFVNDNRVQHSELTSTSNIGITGLVLPQISDIGKTADIFAVFRSITNGVSAWYYLNTLGQYRLWTGRVADLLPLIEAKTLTESNSFSVFRGLLLTGEYRIFVGYRLADGSSTLFFNGTGYLITVRN